MQSAEERRRLMSYLDTESVVPLWAVVLKCATGIVVLVVIAAGPWVFLSASGPMAAPAAGEQHAAQAKRPISSSLAESKRVFDARRAAYESSRQAITPTPRNHVTGQRLAVK